MTTPSTGSISFSQITAEFGSPSGNNFGSFRVNQTIGDRSWPLDDGVPTSGSISFSQLRGKTVNVIVDYSGAAETNINSQSRYTSNGTVVGGFRGIPNSSQTKKVIHLIRKQLGSFDSGTWDSNTLSLRYLITSSGSVYGVGGAGGAGSASSGGGSPGSPGSPAMTVRYPSTIENSGTIQCGFGGGGGGGGSYADPNKNPADPVNTGGGGGGGAGFPAGAGGASGTGAGGGGCNGAAGSTGLLSTGGAGGAGARCGQGSHSGGTGGAGGSPAGNAQSGGNGSGGNLANGTGGNAGTNGFGVFKPISFLSVTISNSGTYIGGTNY
jgi:hypothetical protein